MAITVPVAGTQLSVANFGNPVATQLNALAVTAWTNVAFLNGWSNYGASYSLTQYRKVGDVVTIRGMMKSGTMAQPAFILPTGFRPPSDLQLTTSAFAGGASSVVALVTIRSDGSVTPQEGGNANFNLNVSYSITP